MVAATGGTRAIMPLRPLLAVINSIGDMLGAQGVLRQERQLLLYQLAAAERLKWQISSQRRIVAIITKMTVVCTHNTVQEAAKLL
jgi:hypothetical protein